MVHRNGIFGLVRFRMLRAAISKYWTWRLASSRGLWDASRAMPTSAISLFSLFIRLLARGKTRAQQPAVTAAGIGNKTVRHFGAGFSASKGSMSGSVVLPIHNEAGEPTHASSRPQRG